MNCFELRSIRFLTALSHLFVALFCLGQEAFAGPAPGAPGSAFSWAPACKQAVGTALEEAGQSKSPVWFTVSEGVLTDVFFPTVDQPQIGDLQFIVTGPGGFFSEQRQDTVTDVSYEGAGMTVRIAGRDKQGRYTFVQRITPDPSRAVLRLRTRIDGLPAGHRVFVLFKPAIQNGGSADLAWANGNGLVATQTEKLYRRPVTAVLATPGGFAAASVGYSGTTDGWQILRRHGELKEQYDSAGPGNLALTGEVRAEAGADGAREFDLSLGFGENESQAADAARHSLSNSFDAVAARYDGAWRRYTEANLPAPLRNDAQAILSQRIVKIHGDKLYRGAMAAGLNKPGIPGGDRAPEANYGGYHLIWPRDLYHASMALLAGGEKQAVEDTLTYFLSTQRSDGSWWQNQWIDGTPYWKGLQMDEVAFPILLAWQIHRKVRPQLTGAELSMVRRAADFLRDHGPVTEQDRWEEIGGFIPSTIAAEIAGLRVATDLLGDPQYRWKADEWAWKLESWLLRNQGPMGRDYFLRVSPSGNPNSDEFIHLANGSGGAKASEILDGGFLELVRLGARDAKAPSILSTLAVYDAPHLTVASQPFQALGGAQAYHRYNRDGYGTQNVGGFWPLLAGERGMYALAAGDKVRARNQLLLMKASAIRGGHLPEQTLGLPGSSAPNSGVAGINAPCPLAWSHAEYLLLARSLEDGAIFDAP